MTGKCQKETSRLLAKGALDQLLTKRGKQIVETKVNQGVGKARPLVG
jgi:hypothetical protein